MLFDLEYVCQTNAKLSFCNIIWGTITPYIRYAFWGPSPWVRFPDHELTYNKEIIRSSRKEVYIKFVDGQQQ